MAVEGLYTGEDLAVVPAGDQDLCARADGGLKDGEGASGELMLLDLSDFVLARQQCQCRYAVSKGREYTYVNSERGLERSSLREVSMCSEYNGG
jgi:hypothetical protein